MAEEVEVRRSARRRRTVSARREAGRIVVLMPEGLSQEQEQGHIDALVAKLRRADSRRAAGGDNELAARAQRLSGTYLQGRARPASVRWVSNQEHRWGSATPAAGTIRLSDRMTAMPDYVIDYVLLHELAHLLIGDHGPRFWALLRDYPHTDRARGFLDGVAFAQGRPPEPGPSETDAAGS